MATTKKPANRKAAPTAKKVQVKKNQPAKKSGPAKKVVSHTSKAVTQPSWSTIHVFGYGESQIIGNNILGKVPNSELAFLPALMSTLSKKQQKGGKPGVENIRMLTIFNNAFIQILPKAGDISRQRILWADVDTKAVEKFAKELAEKVSQNGHRRFNFMNHAKDAVERRARIGAHVQANDTRKKKSVAVTK